MFCIVMIYTLDKNFMILGQVVLEILRSLSFHKKPPGGGSLNQIRTKSGLQGDIVIRHLHTKFEVDELNIVDGRRTMDE